MTREEAISEWTFRSNHIKKWLDEYGEEPSIRHYVELIDMAIDALLKADAAQKLREMPRYLNGVKANQIKKIPSEAVEVVRCNDCKWHFNGHLCKQLSQYGSIETPPSFYCGFGERRQ